MSEGVEIVILQGKVRSLETRVKNLEMGNIIREQAKKQAGEK